MSKPSRETVGVARTILCATRFWSIDHIVEGGYRKGSTTPTSRRAVRMVVRKQGHTPKQIDKALRVLERGGFVKIGKRTIALTDKGGRVGCGTVKLAPWTNDEYPGSDLRGYRRR